MALMLTRLTSSLRRFGLKCDAWIPQLVSQKIMRTLAIVFVARSALFVGLDYRVKASNAENSCVTRHSAHHLFFHEYFPALTRSSLTLAGMFAE